MDVDAINKLSDRQRDCLRLVAQLQKTEQIADELGISPSTVNTHIERAIAILGARGRREAALMVQAAEAGCREKHPTEISRLSGPAEPAPPFPSSSRDEGRQRNDLTWTQRMALAMICLAVLCIAVAGLGAAIEQLSDWRSSLAPPSPRAS